MKKILAMIKPVDRDDIVSALHQIENFSGAFESKVRYIPRGMHQTNEQLKEKIPFEEEELIRLEFFIEDELEDAIVKVLKKNNENNSMVSIQKIDHQF